MVELMDLSSAIQLACGINFAGSVIMDRHKRFVDIHTESVDYARNVVIPQVEANKAEKDKIDEIRKWAARVEADILTARLGTARFSMRLRIRRLQVLCFFAGVLATIALLLPAFVPHLAIPAAWAICLLVVIFTPIPLALLRIHGWHVKSEKPIMSSKQKMHNAIQDAFREVSESSRID